MRYAARQLATPVGPMLAVVDEAGALVRLDFLHRGRTAASVRDEILGQEDEWAEDATACAAVAAQLDEYFRGDRTAFDLELAPRGTPFQRKVWRALEGIPYGTTISYGELARRVGRPNASRAVGRANGSNPIAVVVPCHRVIGADGSLTGYASGVDLKQRLLELEGALPPRLDFG